MGNELVLADFWCYSDESTLELFERFRRAFPVDDDGFIHDAENVWEWLDGKTADQSIGFNICRPWEYLDEHGVEHHPVPGEPIRFSIRLSDQQLGTDRIGSQLASALNLAVHCGSVKYLKGDDFEYQVSKTYLPKESNSGEDAVSDAG